MTGKEKKDALKYMFNECARNYINTCKEFEKTTTYLDFLKERHADEYADKIKTLEAKCKEIYADKLTNWGKYNAVKDCCALMLTFKEYDELMFFAPHY